MPAQLAAQGALNGNGLEREFPQSGRHVAAAKLAGHDEGLAARWRREHGDTIGEDEANIFTACPLYREQLYGCHNANPDMERHTNLVMFLQNFFLMTDRALSLRHLFVAEGF